MPRPRSSGGTPPTTAAADRAPSRTSARSTALSEQMYLILVVLADGPRHGYGILRELEHRSDGQHQMLTGTLYNALRRLEAHGLVDASEVSEEAAPSGKGAAAGGPRRTKSYRITAAGLEGLRAEAQRMRTLLRWTPSDALAPALEEGR